MDRLNLNQHISTQYNEELEDIRSKVLAMGGMVEEQLYSAITALVDSDSDLAAQVIRSDYKVNALEVEIDEDCTLVLARRQPAASDLRLVIAVIKTITDLERIGDEAERIARMAESMSGHIFDRAILGEFTHMGELVRDMLHDVLDAFARTDFEAAVKVVKQDERVDVKYESILRQLITYMIEDPRSIPLALNILWSARSLERMGDRCQNIAEYILYLVKGKDVRHTRLDQVLEELGEDEEDE